MAKYRLTIIEDPDGLYMDFDYDFTATSEKSARIYAMGLMNRKASTGDSLGHLKKYNSKTKRFRRIGVFSPGLPIGYTYTSERR